MTKKKGGDLNIIFSFLIIGLFFLVRLEDISYHSTPAPTIPFTCETQNGSTEESNDTEKQAHSFLPITADEGSQSSLVISEAMANQVREEISSNISHTGYGYIGCVYK